MFLDRTPDSGLRTSDSFMSHNASAVAGSPLCGALVKYIYVNDFLLTILFGRSVGRSVGRLVGRSVCHLIEIQTIENMN